MNDYKRIILQRNQQLIYNDVTDPSDIVTHLLSKNVITHQERESILNMNPNKTASLLNLLFEKEAGSSWFEEFISALSKDYDWISKKLCHEYYEEAEAKMTYYLSGKGHVPPLPQHNVTRSVYVKDLRKAIANLKREDFLIVHGMPGWGKTCLVVDALNNIEILEEYLDGCVYWISVGDMGDEPHDLQCTELQRKLCDMVNLPVNNQQDYFPQLKRYFSVKPNISALLVLDKVKSAKVIDALNVGCKILVTTQDTEVVKKYGRKKFFPIREGFSEHESVKLLQDFVYDNGKGSLMPNFKDIAIQIHHSWKGLPMAIGLIGGELSEFREESQRNISRWQQHIRQTHQGDHGDTRRNSLVAEKLSKVIELTTSKLKDDLKNRFEMLVVLVEDTNITIDVLKILWDLNEVGVRHTLDQLYRRSLVIQKVNSKDIPVYGVHDMVMDYLTHKTADPAFKEKNKDLILKYLRACDGNFAYLPQDNYIFSYLCHHIECANLWNSYRDQLLSLRYIQSKLRATGPADLLLDLNKYRYGLSGENSEYNSKIEEIKHLVEDYGWEIYSKNEIDIVQCALLQPKDSQLYLEGVKLAKESNPSLVYFCSENSWEKPKDLVMDVPLNVTSVSLTSSSLSHSIDRCFDHRVLIYPYVGDGKIYIGEVDIRYRRARRSFNAPDGTEVVMLKVSPSSDRFLSAHSNGFVNVWALSSADTPPPSMRQRDFSPFYCDLRTTASLSYSHNRKVTCTSFSIDGKQIISSSEDSSVHVWNLDSNSTVNKVYIKPPIPYAISCAFVSGDEVFAYVCQNFEMYFHELHSPNPFAGIQLSKDYGNLICLLSVTDEKGKLLIVQEKAVLETSCKNQTLSHRRFGDRPPQYNHSYGVVLCMEPGNSITCAAYCKKHRLLLGTYQGCQLYYDMFNANRSFIAFGSGKINAVDMIDNRVVYVRDGSINLCWPHLNNQSSIEKLPTIAHIGWNSKDYSVFTTVTSTGEIKVYHDGKLVYDDINSHKRPSIVRHHKDNVLLGTFDGEVLHIDTISKNKHLIMDEMGMEVKYLSVEKAEDPLYIVGSEGNDKCYLQVFNQKYRKVLSEPVSAQVIKTFTSQLLKSLIVVLRDYSILAYSFNKERLSMVHEGRVSAHVTDACFSDKRSMLFVTDSEKCYHVFELQSTNQPLDMRSLQQTLSDYEKSKDSSDEIDGVRVSSLSNSDFDVPLNTHPLKGPSWCCCICSEENLVAIGCDTNRILIYNTNKKKVISEFEVMSNQKIRISQLKFSPYNVKIRNFQFDLILFVVTDCLSLWDISSLIHDNAGYAVKNVRCVGCVNASGSPLLELSINDACNRFCAFDKNLSYFLWKIWKGDEN
ncbi:Apoptotic protease-activating factor 1 [Frankliniella fusca]|uniref:Apoptotic protease-activating factor 1 n=1 Tax=Frankliniella fusca TaxID=407009 RepID=A0AAE1GS19_9NEOP|nr:Apoptotic protease-activating factor 1 [Frankliniella fusca]